MAAERQGILKLYKLLLRESEKFNSYNYRMYALRRIKDAFRENKILANDDIKASAIKDGESALEIIQRQVVVSNLYKSQKLVIE